MRSMAITPMSSLSRWPASHVYRLCRATFTPYNWFTDLSCAVTQHLCFSTWIEVNPTFNPKTRRKLILHRPNVCASPQKRVCDFQTRTTKLSTQLFEHENSQCNFQPKTTNSAQNSLNVKTHHQHQHSPLHTQSNLVSATNITTLSLSPFVGRNRYSGFSNSLQSQENKISRTNQKVLLINTL